jgi:hypothetical protein
MSVTEVRVKRRAFGRFQVTCHSLVLPKHMEHGGTGERRAKVVVAVCNLHPSLTSLLVVSN